MKVILFLIVFIQSISFANNSGWYFVDKVSPLVKGIKTIDSNLSYLLGSHFLGTDLYKSTDRGISWELIYIDYATEEVEPYLINNMDFTVPDKDNIFIRFLEKKGTIRKSTDGGETFSKISIVDSNVFIAYLKMYNKDIGIAITSDSIIYTHDSWESSIGWVDTMFRSLVEPLELLDSNTIIFMHASNQNGDRLIKYDLSSRTYEVLFQFEPEEAKYSTGFSNLEIINEDLSFMAGGRRKAIGSLKSDLILRSKKSFTDWEFIIDQDVEPIWGLQEISFYDENNGFAGGAGGKIYMTNDGGDSWTIEVPSDIFQVGDSTYGPYAMVPAWIGRTPVFGSRSAGNMYRYEGDFFKFIKEIPQAQITYPPCQADSLNANITFDWDRAEGSKFYHFQLSLDPNMNEILFEEQDFTKTSYYKNGLDSGQTYYWRVRGYNQETTSPWSEICSFSIIKKFNTILENDKNILIEQKENQLIISLKLAQYRNSKVQISNAQGKNILTQKLENQRNIINLNSLTSGIYFYNIIVDGIKFKTNKFIINK